MRKKEKRILISLHRHLGRHLGRWREALDLTRLDLLLIRIVSLIVPRRLRQDWKQEWESELLHREDRLTTWRRLDLRSKADLLRRSSGALRDALVLQPRRLEDEVIQDLRHGARLLRRNPGLALTAVFTLALGIGANTAIFSLVSGILLKPLPYPDADRLVRVWEDPGDNPRNNVNPRNYADWRASDHIFSSTAAFSSTSLSLTGEGEPERVVCANATASFFAALGIAPLHGRAFLAGEDEAGSERVVVLSHRLWARRFASDPSAIGKSLELDGESYTIIGVMPEDFRFPRAAELYRPLVFTPGMLAQTSRGSHYLGTVARLRDGVTVEEAQAEMSVFYGRLREQYPDQLARWSVHVYPMLDDTVGGARLALVVLFGAVAMVLLIACANVAALLIARGLARRREIAVRAALGAGPWRIARQFLGESLLIALLGGAAGLLAGYGGLRLLIYLEPENLPRLDEASIDARVLLFTLGISVLTALVAGIGPAIAAARASVNEALKDGGARSGGASRARRWRRALVVVEAAMAVVLLAGAGLMMRSFARVISVEPGFRAEGVLTMRVALPRRAYAETHQRVDFYRRVVESVRTLPGVEAAAFVSDPPVSGSEGLWENRFDVEGRPIPPPGQMLFSYLRWVTPDYFRALGIRLVRGRLIDDRDLADRPWVVVIDERMAQKFFAGEDPIGKRIMIYSGPNEQMREIIGIVSAVRATALEQEPEPHMYVPYYQTPQGYATLLVRASSEPENLAAAVKGAIRGVDPRQPVYAVSTMEELIAETIEARRFNMLMLGLFAAVALLLAGVGIYGVISYSVSERRQEIGVRMALGASRGDILRLVVGEGMRLALSGIVVGLGGAAALMGVLRNLLFGVSPYDPVTMGAISIVLGAVAAAACYLPARRALRTDPMIALRAE